MLFSNQYILLFIILIIIIILCMHNNKFEFFDLMLVSDYPSSISSINNYINSSRDDNNNPGLSSSIQSLQNLFVKKSDSSFVNKLETRFNAYDTMINDNVTSLNFNNISEKYKNIYDGISSTISDINIPQTNLSVVL